LENPWKEELICSDCIKCGCGSKNTRQHGDHLQIPVAVKSDPDGPKMLQGEIDCARNPKSHVCKMFCLRTSAEAVLGPLKVHSLFVALDGTTGEASKLHPQEK
jgi:hypothetical protein